MSSLLTFNISHFFLVFLFSSVDFEHEFVCWVKSKSFAIKTFPRKEVPAQSQQLKHWIKVWNMFKVNSKDNSTTWVMDVVLLFLLLTLNIFHTLWYSPIITSDPSIYLPVQSNNRNTRTSSEICSKLTIKTPEQCHWCCFGVFVNFEQFSQTVLVFLLLTLSMHLFAGMAVYFIFFSVCHFFFFFDETWKSMIIYLDIPVFYKISAVDFRLFLKNCYSYFSGYFFKNPFGCQ